MDVVFIFYVICIKIDSLRVESKKQMCIFPLVIYLLIWIPETICGGKIEIRIEHPPQKNIQEPNIKITSKFVGKKPFMMTDYWWWVARL